MLVIKILKKIVSVVCKLKKERKEERKLSASLPIYLWTYSVEIPFVVEHGFRITVSIQTLQAVSLG